MVLVFSPFSKPEYFWYAVFGVFSDPKYIRYSVKIKYSAQHCDLCVTRVAKISSVSTFIINCPRLKSLTLQALAGSAYKCIWKVYFQVLFFFFFTAAGGGVWRVGEIFHPFFFFEGFPKQYYRIGFDIHLSFLFKEWQNFKFNKSWTK